MTSLQRSSLHYFQRPDADWVEVDETATSLSGWAGPALHQQAERATSSSTPRWGPCRPASRGTTSATTPGATSSTAMSRPATAAAAGPGLPQLDGHGLVLPELRLRRQQDRRVHLPRRQGPVPQLLDGDPASRLRAAQIQPLPDPGRAHRLLPVGGDGPGDAGDRRPQAADRPFQRLLSLPSERRLQLVARRRRHLEAEPELQPLGRAELHLALLARASG